MVYKNIIAVISTSDSVTPDCILFPMSDISPEAQEFVNKAETPITLHYDGDEKNPLFTFFSEMEEDFKESHNAPKVLPENSVLVYACLG